MNKQSLIAILTFVLLAVVRCPLPPGPTDEIDQNTHSNYLYVTMQSQEMFIELDFENQVLKGRAIQQYKSFTPVSSVVLDCFALDVTKAVIVKHDGEDDHQVTDFNIETTDMPDGNKLTIEISPRVEALTTFEIEIEWNTVHSPSPLRGVNFVDQEDTTDKLLPMFYTQFEPIQARSFMPIMDTPNIKFTWKAEITVPSSDFDVYMSGKIKDQNANVHLFEQTKPVASYMIAIVAGRLDRQLLPNSSYSYVIAEPSLLERGSEDFHDIELYIKACESVLNLEYQWPNFQVVIMPPNYPYEGMQHPELTYVSPSVLDSGQEGVSVVFNQIAKSWFGNVVTAGNWRNVWLNEGFAKYIERDAQMIFFNENYKELDRVVGNFTLIETIEYFGEESTLTSLYPETKGLDPTDIISAIPMEKGYQFLEFIKQEMDSFDQFHTFLKDWYKQYEYKVVEQDHFETWFTEYIEEYFYSKDILAKIDFEAWIRTPGLIPKDTLKKYESDYWDATYTLAYKFLQFEGTSIPSDYLLLESWTQDMVYGFLDFFLSARHINLTSRRLCNQLDNLYDFSHDVDLNVQSRWFTLAIINNYDHDLTMEIEEFLGKTGRISLLLPVYEAFQISGRHSKGNQYLNIHKEFYHPIAVKEIEEILLEVPIE